MTDLFLFLLSLGAGIVTSLPWLPAEDLGPGYFRIQALLATCALALAAAVSLSPATAGPGDGGSGWHPSTALLCLVSLACGALLLYHALVAREGFRSGLPVLAVAGGAALAALLVASPYPATSDAAAVQSGLRVISRATSALLLGWSVGTMLLGHWYLVVPRLRFDPLRRYCALLVAWVGLRSCAVGAVLVGLAMADRQDDGARLEHLVSLAGEGPFFWLRVLWGLAIPLILGTMALLCARRRANQSATGILYVLVMGVLIGEVVALHLARITGWPV